MGQEIIAYSNPTEKKQLFYWAREGRTSQAEVDYVENINNEIVPIEVKSGSGTTLKSMHLFLEKHVNSKFGIKFSTQNYSEFEKILSYPLYAIFTAMENKEI